MQRVRNRCLSMEFEDKFGVLNDLQLAAELGKTLLERNKELETNLRQQQNVVEDRNQEIEYLTKQTAALREVNDSRLRIYEQLEISIQDLERNNQRLVQENINDKKHIKSLYETIESLESRCEDLQHIVDDMGHLKKDDSVTNSEENVYGGSVNDDQDDYSKLVSQLEHAKNQKAKEQRKVSELEQNVSLLMQENTNLEEKVCVLQQKDEELKTLQDQIVYLEEIRQGNLCRRCQRSTDQNQFDEYSVYDDDDDTDDISAIGSYVETHKHEVLQQLQETLGENYSEDNPYRILVDKYEALLKIQQKHNAFTSTLIEQQKDGQQQNHGISLHEELQMSGQFSSFNGNALTDSEDEDETAAAAAAATTHMQRPSTVGIDGGARCKYSETETTSSSGFSDETSNKCTQTETFFTGSFLCTISDGDDCRFSIYDDASPVESRFRKTPEYRQLFREIFAVLKRAAEAKDEGERLPLLQDTEEDEHYCEYDGANDCDDCDDDDDGGDGVSGLKLRPEAMLSSAGPKVPPATPACENNPLVASILQQQSEAGDDSSPMQQQQHQQHQQQQQQQQVEPSANAAKHDGSSHAQKRRRSTSRQLRSCKPEADQPAAVANDEQQPKQQQPVASKQTRRQRDIIEELASTVKHKKHARHHRKSASAKSRDISHLMEFKWTDQVTRRQRSAVDSGSADDRSPSHRATWCVPNDAESAATPYASTASQEVAKLKLLEKSYAEVLRLRKPPSNRPQSQYFNRTMH